MKKEEPTTIRLTNEIKQKLKEIAKQEDRSVSSIIRVLIIEALRKRGFKVYK